MIKPEIDFGSFDILDVRDAFKGFCPMQVWSIWTLFLTLLASSIASQTEFVFDGQSCRVLKSEAGVFGIGSLGTFILTIDLNLDLPDEFLKRYRNVNDTLGARCSERIKLRYNQSLSAFENKIRNLKNEQDSLYLYIHDNQFLGRKPRDAGTIFAIIVSIANALATSLNIFVSQTTLHDLNARLDLLSRTIVSLQNSQEALRNNIDFLHEEASFLGIEKNLIVNHLNAMHTIHSCEIVSLDFESRIADFEMKLDKILTMVYENQLSHHMIDRNTLETITMHHSFKDTLYRVSPSKLYEFSKVRFIDSTNEKISFLIVYPEISRTYSYNLVTMLEAPQRIVFSYSNPELENSFLLPTDIALNNISRNLDTVRSTDGCKVNHMFFACPAHTSITDSCFRSLFSNTTANCFSTRIDVTQPFHYRYDKLRESVLVRLDHNSQIVKDDKLLFSLNDSNDTMCILLNRQRNLKIESGMKSVTLFPNARVFSHRKKPLVQKYLVNSISKLSLPHHNRTKSFVPMHIDPIAQFPTNHLMTLAIFVSSALVLIFVSILCLCCCFKFLIIDGRKLFSHQ